MAIKWGSARTDGTNAGRLGYEFSRSPSTITTNTSSVTVTLRLYFQSKYTVYDSSNSWSISGNFSGSGAASISHGSSSAWSSSNITRIATRSITVTPSYTGTTTRSFSASITGINAVRGTMSVSGSYSVPRRPVNNPYAPSGLSVTRNGDTSHSLKWTNNSATSNSRPYDSIQIRRWDIAAGSYKTIATVSPRTSYTDRTTTSNQRYRYIIRARNAAGYSDYEYSSYVATTPAAPSSIRARKTTSGDISITWSLSGVRYNTGVEVWATANGVDQSTRLTLRSANSTSYTHVSPDATKTWSYRVRAVASGITGSFSARSNTIQLLTNPLAPTQLSPNSEIRDATQDMILTWQHNEVDGTDQRKFQVAHRAAGTSTWTYTSEITSALSEYLLPADTYENGQTVEWRVRTWGMFASAGPYSNSATVPLSTPPSGTILSPVADEVIGSSSLSVEWEFYDPEGEAQAQWRITLLDANGDTLETRSGSGGATEATFDSVVADGAAYQVQLEVRDSTGLWSEPDIIPVTVTYPPPPVPEVAATWDHETGAVVVEILNPPEDEDEVPAAHNDLWRSIDGGQWILVASYIPLNTAVTDYIPALGTVNYYRVTATSDMPSQSISQAATAETYDHRWWVWINAGAGFVNGVRIRDNAEISLGGGRAKELRRFAGRSKPVEFVGEQRELTIGLSARFAPESSTPQDFWDIADIPAPACIRTPDGQRYFVSIGDPSITMRGVRTELSLDFTQVDHIETETNLGDFEL